MPPLATTASTPQRAVSASRRARAATSTCMSATSRWETSPAPASTAIACSGWSVWTWIFSVQRVADDEHRVAERLERLGEAARVEALAGDGEVRAVAVGRGEVLGMGDARRHVVLERRWLLAAQRRDDAREDHDQRVAAGVDDARVAQHREQVGGAHDRRLARRHRPLEQAGDRRRPAPREWCRARSRVSGMCASSTATRCAISRTTVRIVPSAGSRTEAYARSAARASAAPIRVGSISSPGRLKSSSAAPWISCERITPLLPRAPSSAARATERTISSRPISSIVRFPAGRQPVELGEHGLHRQHHVVAGVAVGDGEDVEVVDLLPPGLQMRERPGDQGAEADQIGVSHDPT